MKMTKPMDIKEGDVIDLSNAHELVAAWKISNLEIFSEIGAKIAITAIPSNEINKKKPLAENGGQFLVTRTVGKASVQIADDYHSFSFCAEACDEVGNLKEDARVTLYFNIHNSRGSSNNIYNLPVVGNRDPQKTFGDFKPA